MLCVINYIELFTFAFNRLNIFCLGSFNIIIKYYSKDGVETKIKFKMTKTFIKSEFKFLKKLKPKFTKLIHK